jgi:hypothetical protein
MDTQAILRDQMAEMAIDILQATDDGDKLSPSDLKLVELAVNDMLNAAGIERFRQLHEDATKLAGYTVPFLFDIEHLTIDHDRIIRWKGVAVEHFDHGVWRESGWQERMRADAAEVAAACRQVESEGIQPTTASVLTRRDSTAETAVPPEKRVDAESKPAQPPPTAPFLDQAVQTLTRGKPLPLNTLYWGENDSHEFWESEDHELLILRVYAQSWWSVLRHQLFQFPIQSADEAAVRLNVTLCRDKLWKRNTRGTFALVESEAD